MMKFLTGVAAGLMITLSTNLHAKGYCGELKNHLGPYDYRTSDPEKLQLVETFHFTPEIEKLQGRRAEYLGIDINYTLRVFPNHHRALASLAKLALREKTPKITNMGFSVECYFERAIRFQADDANIRTLYGAYLYKLNRIDQAIAQLSEAVNLDPANATANHNLGLIYFQKKDYEKALIFAKKADALGFPLHGLKTKLVEMGKWETAPVNNVGGQ